MVEGGLGGGTPHRLPSADWDVDNLAGTLDGVTFLVMDGVTDIVGLNKLRHIPRTLAEGSTISSAVGWCQSHVWMGDKGEYPARS